MDTLDVLSKEFGFDYKEIPESFMDSVQLNGTTFLHSLLNEFHPLKEEDNYEITHEFEDKGGIIIFSVNVNSVFGSEQGLLSRVQGIYHTIKNRLMKNRKLNSILFSHEEVSGVSIGNFFKGRYSSKNGTYDESSMSVEIIGITFDLLCVIASELAKEFNQESVLVKDNESRRIVLVAPQG